VGMGRVKGKRRKREEKREKDERLEEEKREGKATTPVSSRLIWEIFYSLVDRSLWQVAPDNLKRFLELGTCFQLCFKCAVSVQHCTPYVIVHWVYIQGIWKPLVFCDDIWTAGPQPVLCAALHTALRAVCADAPSCWKMSPVGSRRLL